MPSKKAKTQNVTRLRPAVDKEQVAKLAYELYLRRGGAHGCDTEDWLTAEAILVEKAYQAEFKRPGRKRVSDERLRLEDKYRSK